MTTVTITRPSRKEVLDHADKARAVATLDESEGRTRRSYSDEFKAMAREAHELWSPAGEFKSWCERAGVPYTSAIDWIHGRRSVAQKPVAQSAPKVNNDLPEWTPPWETKVKEPAPLPPAPAPPALPDGVHEAGRGFQAGVQRYIKLRGADTPKALEWRDVALQHFKFLVAASNLPQIMSMDADQIVNLLSL